MTQKALLEEYLGQLKLPTFVQNYEQYAQDALRGDSTHEQYLLALCEAEIAQRKVNSDRASDLDGALSDPQGVIGF